jgi:hypothetical protein
MFTRSRRLPWHYVPAVARKPGALRNGAPFKNSVLQASRKRVRRRLANAEDGAPADGRYSRPVLSLRVSTIIDLIRLSGER